MFASETQEMLGVPALHYVLAEIVAVGRTVSLRPHDVSLMTRHAFAGCVVMTTWRGRIQFVILIAQCVIDGVARNDVPSPNWHQDHMVR